MLSYLTFPHRPSTGVQTARSDSDYAEAGLQEESENCKRGVWHIKKKKNNTTYILWGKKWYQHSHRDMSWGQGWEQKQRVKEKARIRKGSGG